MRYYGNNEKPAKKLRFWIEHPPAAVAVDVETVSIEERHPIGLALAFSPHEAYYFQLHPEPEEGLEKIAPILRNVTTCKLAHNWMFDMGVFPLIPKIGDSLDRSNIFDTNVAARLLGNIETQLSILAGWHGFGITPATEMLRGGKTMLDIAPDEVADHCLTDARATYQLYFDYKDEIFSKYGEYFNTEMTVIPILCDLSMRGIALDQQARAELQDRYEDETEFYRRYLQTEYGISNPNSPQQVGYVLAERGNFLPLTRSKRQLSTRKEELEFLDDPLAAAILNYRNKSKFLSTYLVPLEGEDRFYTEYYMDTAVGRLNSRNRNIQNIPPDARVMMLPDRGMFTTGDYCLDPDTKILTADLRWIRIGDAKVGDTLAGIDEYPEGGKGKRRRMRTATVQSVVRRTLPAYSILLDDGTYIVASGEHPWYRQEPGYKTYNPWIETSQLRPGMHLRRCARPWQDGEPRDMGYLAGALDGEGWVDQSGGANNIGFAQNENEMFYTVLDIENRIIGRDKIYIDDSKKTIRLLVKDMASCMKLLGMARPPRLLSEFSFDGREPPYKDSRAKVLAVNRIGDRELVSIQTSTHTYVAEGIFTHNSQEHLYILMHFSGDRAMRRVYEDGYMDGDIHAYTAHEMGITRRLAKTVNYAICYGATDKTISEQAKIRDRKRCSKLLDDWFGTFTGAAEWIRSVQAASLRSGWSESTLFGRQIRIPEEYNRFNQLNVDGMKRKACNYPILGSDGEVIKRAIIMCNRRGLGPPTMAITVHDSITWDGDVELPVEDLENIPGFRIPFEVKQTFRWE